MILFLNNSNEIFTLKIRPVSPTEKPFIGIHFFDDNKCKIELDGRPIDNNGKYELYHLQIQKNKTKTIYIKHKSFGCRAITLYPSKTNYEFKCYTNSFEDSPDECNQTN